MIPEPPLDALTFLAQRTPQPSLRDTAGWNRVMPQIRAKSFFSARVEDARFLDRAKGLLSDFLENSKEQTASGEDALKVGSRADFVRQMREFMVSEGIVDEGEFGEDNDITNTAGARRLELIFDTNIRQAHGYAYRSQGMKPEILNAFPAQRFIRIAGAEDPRPRHTAAQDEVRIKTDVAYWADWHNAAEIGGFEVPWAPFGFNSYMRQEDVDRATSEELGLVQPGERLVSPESEEPTKNLKVSTKTMDSPIRRRLIEKLKAKRKANQSATKLAAEAADTARENAILRTRDAAITRGDQPAVDRAQRALESLESARDARGVGEVFDVQLAGDGKLRYISQN